MVSVIVPVYNVERYIDKCIQSVIEQTYCDWELLLIDDGSTDNSGVICDGAKASCAAKIASAIDSAILGMHMVEYGKEFCAGEGIVTKGVENTIKNVGRLASDGMKKTDEEIINIMIRSNC